MQLVKDTDPALKQKSTPWEFGLEEQSADEFEDGMIDLMIKSNGIGLAANQVGITKRVFAIQLANNRRLAMFNPRVISASEIKEEGEEGCLSFPNLYLKVLRPKEIVSEYFDKNGQSCTITLSGLEARCFLHELDHLNGVCFTENVSPLKLAMAIKKQKKRSITNG